MKIGPLVHSRFYNIWDCVIPAMKTTPFICDTVSWWSGQLRKVPDYNYKWLKGVYGWKCFSHNAPSTIDFIILMTQVFNKNHTELFERGHGNNGVQGRWSTVWLIFLRLSVVANNFVSSGHICTTFWYSQSKNVNPRFKTMSKSFNLYKI